MTEEAGPNVNMIIPSNDNESFQAEQSHDDDLRSPSNELSTPSFTPPPPIDCSDSLSFPSPTNPSGNSSRSVPPMFIYSYDPPSPEFNSEYDPPPFISPPPSELTKDNHVSHRLESNENPVSNEHCQSHTNTLLLLRPDSDLSSTLSASLLLTQDSDISPLPPHAERVSPMNTDTLTSCSPNIQQFTSDPSVTYTCTSPSFSLNSDNLSNVPDQYFITTPTFHEVEKTEPENSARSSPDDVEAKDSRTPDTICVSPLHSERASHSYSKTSEDQSIPTRSVSESHKKSTEGNTGSSDRARRSSPQSSPDQSLSSLPSDTITMNTGIDSIGTDTDSNENPAVSQSNRVRASQSVHSQDETDQTIDSAFASPSTSPTCTLSCSVTPVPSREKKSASVEHRTTKESDEGFEKESFLMPSRDDAVLDNNSGNKGNLERYSECNSNIDLADEVEAAENESIYPESECEIRLGSRADTESADYSHRDSSPDVHTTSVIAELCQLEEEKDKITELPENLREAAIVRNPSSSSMKEISSSGNSSMSNSPAFLAETSIPCTRRNLTSDSRYDVQSNNNNAHLTNWLRSSRPSEGISNEIEPNGYSPTNSNVTETENGIIIEEIFSETLSYNTFNGGRSFPVFGPLPTIHEVADTPPDITPVSDTIILPTSANFVGTLNYHDACNSDSSSITSYFVRSDSPQDGSASAPFYESKTSAVSYGNVPPPPPPRSMKTQSKTPPVPPPPVDDDDFNPIPLPPPPSDDACLPPLPPPPATYYNECAPPVPPHAIGPIPPQRMYLLIPIAPELRSPQRVLSPPPAPQRSTSLRRSPPPSPPVKNTNFSALEHNRLTEFNSFMLSMLNEETNEEERTMSSPSDVGSVICVSSKLTPLPEERSPNVSPLPPTLLMAAPQNLTRPRETNAEPRSMLTNSTTSDTSPSFTSNNASFLSPPLPPARQKKSLTPPLPPNPSNSILFHNSSKNAKGTLEKLAETKLETESSQTELGDRKMAPPPPPPSKPTCQRAKTSPSAHLAKSSQPESSASSPLMSFSASGKLVVDRSDMPLPSAEEEVGGVFRSAVRWGFLVEGVDTVAMYTQIRPIIQRGPQCGLVALSMASQICGPSGASSRCPSAVPPATPTTPGSPPGKAGGVSSNELLEEARTKGFSTHGEMFSAESLASLANLKLGYSMEACVRRGILQDKHVFLELILAGALLLVPYDAQHNHQPGKFNGHKAHWGVVSGALVQSRRFSSGVSSAAAFARPDSRIDNLWHVRRAHHSSSRSSSRAPSRAEEFPIVEEVAKISTKSRRERSSSPPWRLLPSDRASRSTTPGRSSQGYGGTNHEAALSAFLSVASEDLNVVVLWRQGKSRTLVSSTLEDLSASNAQLTEYPQAQADNSFERDFVIGNVEDGLAGQVVVLNKTTQPLTDLSELLDRLQN
ncbi:flocculation protein FLO11 [Hyalella azteca]|uniref:Actin maturation protease n=1 Tax=Hyalella azteca TaxID=294128 RepID=A0A8B7NB98_HYAAZ|nr:flocculation protein FLO11 [Hyalella azteca]